MTLPIDPSWPLCLGLLILALIAVLVIVTMGPPDDEGMP